MNSSDKRNRKTCTAECLLTDKSFMRGQHKLSGGISTVKKKMKKKKMYQRPSGLTRDWMRNQWRLYPEVATQYFMETFLSDIFEGSNHQTATFVREIRLSTPCQKFILICSHQASWHIYPSNSTSSPIALIKRFTFALFCAPSSGGKVLLALTFSITRSL